MKIIKTYPFSILWGIIISILSLMPGKDMPQINIVNFDKIAHLGVYAILAFLICLETNRSGYLLSIRQKYWIIVIIVLGSILLELLQGTMHVGRHFEVFDIIANALGAILGTFVIFPLYYKYFKKRF